MNSNTNYALMQYENGITQLNAASGKLIHFGIANAQEMKLSSSALYPNNTDFNLGTTNERWKLYATSIDANSTITASGKIIGAGLQTSNIYL